MAKYTGITLTVLALLAGAWWWGTAHRGPDPALLPAPIASAAFDDGSRIQLLQTAHGSIEHGTLHPRSGLRFSSSTESFGLQSNPRITVATRNGNKWPVGLGFQCAYPDALFIEFQWASPSGAAIWPKVVYDAGSTKFVDMNHAVGSTGSPSRDTKIELLVQIADGKGGWITADGPLARGDDSHAVCIALLPTWPRDASDLKIRFISDGQAPLEFTAPNPAPRVTPGAVWPTSPLPVSSVHAEGTVVLESVRVIPVTDGFPLIEPTARFTPARGAGWYYKWKFTEAHDQTGNQAPFSYLMTGGYENGFQLPEVKTPVRLLGKILSSDGCLRTRLETVIIASGTIAADGSLSPVLTPEGTRLGVVEASGTALPPDRLDSIALFSSGGKKADFPGNPSVAPLGLGLSMKGDFEPAGPGASADRNKLGDHQKWQLVAFVDGEAETSGISMFRGSSYSSSGSLKLQVGPVKMGGDPMTEVELRTDWLGRFAVGQKVELGLVAPKPQVDVEFTIERP